MLDVKGHLFNALFPPSSAMSIAESSKTPGYGEDGGLSHSSSSNSFATANSHHHLRHQASNASSSSTFSQRTQLWTNKALVN